MIADLQNGSIVQIEKKLEKPEKEKTFVFSNWKWGKVDSSLFQKSSQIKEVRVPTKDKNLISPRDFFPDKALKKMLWNRLGGYKMNRQPAVSASSTESLASPDDGKDE